ncbi:DNA adenine methylase [Companilactobacillus versmoldensis]|uniref:Site-specific DNA-methyltransferase (adenine-specific) n=1 Tax=Companilactobacillus versmoldensis DSM 14857 = KCTC 3814 TaxID=1423815 RepID=A0A0R1SH34_9LACO|nr:DNA adenine methylase [Companilactobacillus versmoldensis]KRL66804.1 adenine-specific DNA methyltransferase [Companilactobacillus versmoldensis DSM 14857 = KCTC 3814]
MSNSNVKPFLKWAGGKRQLLPEIQKYYPTNFNKYYEPFVGGGAVAFDLQPSQIVINDFNEELTNVYQVIKNDSDELIYLNKTCFNGLFRVNSKNQFNVPYASNKNPNIVNEDVIRADSKYFNDTDIKIETGDFTKVTEDAKNGDFIYFDPPYAPVSESASFVSYTSGGFGVEEQTKLRDLFVDLDRRGCYVMLSNSSVDLIHELYKDYEKTTHIIKANRAINSNGKKRGKVDEVLIMNY